MAKSPVAVRFDGVQQALKPFMKQHRFIVKGRTFNRTTEDGLIQVVNFQMGASDPPGTKPIPGFRENLHGWFTVNLGIYVPEVAEHLVGQKAGSFVQEYDCCIRARLGAVGPEKADLWWRVATTISLLGEIQARLEHHALPYFERHASRDAILRACRKRAGTMGEGGYPARIVAAIILAERGDKKGARDLLTRQAQRQRNHRHPEVVSALAERLGLGPLGL